MKEIMYQLQEKVVDHEQRLVCCEKDISYVKKWLCGLENYLHEWEEFIQIHQNQKQVTIDTNAERISPRQIQFLKQKIKEKGNARKTWAKLKKHFAISKYSLLPTNRWEEALQWLEDIKI